MKSILLVSFLILFASCSETVARRPVTQKSGSYVNSETINRNRELIAQDEALIKTIIKKDTVNEFVASPNGFWYTYMQKDTLGMQTPVLGDLVLFQYDIQTIDGRMLVTKEEMGNAVSKIDQSNQDIVSGIREGLKLMKEGETVTFLFPSHKAYGYYGLDNKVSSNTPVRSTVTLLEIKDQPKE